MYNKICMLVVLSFVTSNLKAMEDAQSLLSKKLLTKNIAEAARALDNAFKDNNEVVVEGEKDHLNQQYNTLITAKKNVQSIQFPINQEGFKVHTLELQYRRIKTACFDMPVYINSHSIQHIDISHNDLEDLPLGCMVEWFPNLEGLNAAHNKIEYVSLFQYKKNLYNKLKTLYLNNNQLKDFDLAYCFKVCPHVKDLDLSENPLESINCPTQLCVNTQYPTINLKHTSLSDENKMTIKNAYIKDAQESLLYKVDIHNVGKGLWGGAGWLCLSGTWVWNINSGTAIAAVVFIPAVVISGSLYCLFNKYYKNKKYFDDLKIIEDQVSQYLLYDTSNTEEVEIPLD